MAELALKAKSQKIATLSLVPPMINTADPDIAVIQQKVAAVIAKAEGRKPAEEPGDTVEAAPETSSAGAGKGTDDGAATSKDRGASTPTSPTTPSDPPAVTGGSLGSLSTGYAANQSEDLGAVC